VICASDESQQPIRAAPIAAQRLQNQPPRSSRARWRRSGFGVCKPLPSRLPGFFDGIVSSGSQYQLQSGKPVPGRDGEEPRSAREYSAATPRVLTISYPMAGGTDIALRRKNLELVGLLH
jgi:hypothetical protein